MLYELSLDAEEDLQKIDISGATIHMKYCEYHYIFGVKRDHFPMLILAIFHERMDLMQRLKDRLHDN